MDNTEKPKPRILSLCTGYGGLDRGIERVLGPCVPVAYVEIEAYAVANLVSKMEAGQMVPAPVWTDLKTFPCEGFRGKVDILTAGYPCQPFSTAGKRKGTDDPRHLFPHIVRIIAAIRPVWCLFENVSAHITLGFPEVYRSLRGLGYAVEAGLFTASEVGAPHKRERLFILAHTQSERTERKPGIICKKDGRQGRPLPRKPNVSGQKLAHPNSQGPRQPAGEICTGRDTVADGGEQELGHPPSDHERGTREALEGSQVEAGRPSTYVADTDNSGSGENIQPTQLRAKGVKQPPRNQGQPGTGKEREVQRWPAKPGNSQHGWEPPRVIGKVEPGLGGNPDGDTNRLDPNRNRVDRLRLCGNGVVPATAELAFRTLIEKFKTLTPKI